MVLSESKILIVDDDASIRRLLVRFLRQYSYQTKEADTGHQALTIFAEFQPNLVILDINLPDSLGYHLCEQMQSRTNVLILMLTSRINAEDKEEGFLKGADDYLTKPFDLQELAWRVKALLRRQRELIPDSQPILALGHLQLDPVRREVFVHNSPVYLTSLEFDLLYYLARHPGRVWNRTQLIEAVWGDIYDGDSRVVDVHIGQIRKKITVQNDESVFIQTIRGVGYRLEI